MSKPVQLFCWHFMSYPYLPADFDEKYDSGWITVPNTLWDREKSRGLLNEYIDQLAYADTLGFDGMVLNEHHQNVYGLMPSPNIIASALSQKTSKGKIVVLANLLPLHGNPLRVAEEYAMVDNMSDGRVIAGFAPGGGQETFNYNTPAAIQREQFWEAVDLIHQAWTRPGPFTFEGKHYPLRYVNPWPQPIQQPHPQVWIPGSQSRETMRQIAQRGYCYFLSSRVHGGAIARARQEFAKILEDAGSKYDPFRMGILMSAYVSETDEQAREESHEGVWYFLKNCLKGHLRNLNGRSLTAGPGIPNMEISDYPRTAGKHQARPGHAGRRRRLGRASEGAIDHCGQPGHRLPANHRSRPRNPGGQSADPVPHGQHARRPRPQKHAAVRHAGRTAPAGGFARRLCELLCGTCRHPLTRHRLQ